MGVMTIRTKTCSNVSVQCLHQPGELKGGLHHEIDPVWSLKIYKIYRLATKEGNMLYNLQYGSAIWFVREELFVV